MEFKQYFEKTTHPKPIRIWPVWASFLVILLIALIVQSWNLASFFFLVTFLSMFLIHGRNKMYFGKKYWIKPHLTPLGHKRFSEDMLTEWTTCAFCGYKIKERDPSGIVYDAKGDHWYCSEVCQVGSEDVKRAEKLRTATSRVKGIRKTAVAKKSKRVTKKAPKKRKAVKKKTAKKKTARKKKR